MTNAIDFEAGDHAKLLIDPVSWVSGQGSPPFGSSSHKPLWLSRSELNAMRLPSGDHAGSVSLLSLRVRRTTLAPSVDAIHRSESYTLRSRSALVTTNTILLPSGVKCGDEGAGIVA